MAAKRKRHPPKRPRETPAEPSPAVIAGVHDAAREAIRQLRALGDRDDFGALAQASAKVGGLVLAQLESADPDTVERGLRNLSRFMTLRDKQRENETGYAARLSEAFVTDRVGELQARLDQAQSQGIAPERLLALLGPLMPLLLERRARDAREVEAT